MLSRTATTFFLLAAFLILAAPSGTERTDDVGACFAADDPPAYYAIDLVTTKRLPGSRLARGTADVLFAKSPFGVALSPNGSYVYDLRIAVEKLAPARGGVYVVWVTTPSLDERVRIGVLDESLRLTGQVAWNKFLVVVSLEPDAAESAPSWTGPIVLRGMSRSGNMHTQAGHGPFETEPCAVYGY
ncbi:hypothetical protein JYT20_00930 [Rhodothermus sp. AH-315-K08]|nr:hypothetical protein [Rhodothermus sp. AH-315-K08]